MHKTAAILLCYALLAGPAAGDIVYMNSGKVHRGKVTRKGDKVLIAGPLATIAVDARDVRKVIRSATPDKPELERPVAPTVTLHVRKTGQEAYTRPESHVFLLMRQLAGMPPAMSYEIQEQIKVWRVKTHDRLRRFRTRWISPDDMDRARREFAETLKKGQSLVTKIRRAGSTTSSGRAAQAKCRRSLATYFRQAASVWPDEIMQDFLLAVAHLEGFNYNGALQLFDRCIAAAPRVAAFRQGKALALAGRNQKLGALGAYLELLHLMPNSREAYDMVVRAMEDTPGTQMTEPAFVMAKEIVALYDAPPKRPYALRGITWLMPGRPWMGRQYTLPTPPYDRLVFRQAIGVPVAQNALVVDQRALSGAYEAFVAIDPNTVVPARIQRTGAYGMGKQAASLGLVYVEDFLFTALKADGTAQVPKGQAVTAHGLGLYEEMGTEIRPIQAIVQEVGPAGSLRLSHTLAPGEVLSPVVTKDGQLAGFLDGKTDPMVDNGGPDRFIPIGEATMLMRRASRTGGSFGGYGRVKRKITPRPAQRQVFVLYITAAEGEKVKRF